MMRLSAQIYAYDYEHDSRVDFTFACTRIFFQTAHRTQWLVRKIADWTTVSIARMPSSIREEKKKIQHGRNFKNFIVTT